MPTANPTHYAKKQGFFSSAAHKEMDQPKDTPCFVNVGGNGDCGFRSVAAGIVDFILSKIPIQPSLIQGLMKAHFNHFPEHEPFMKKGLVTPLERFERMIKTVPTRELIQALGYTIRQMTVDELQKHPEKYRGAFTNQNESTSPQAMRQTKTWIDESAIAAASYALNLPIKVHAVENHKTLPLNLTYNQDAKGAPEITIRLQHGHYVPYLRHPSKFNTVRVESQIEPVNVPDVNNASEDLQDVLKRIDEDDKRIKESFETCRARLNTMVQAGELSQEDLFNIYIQKMGDSDYLTGRVKYIGAELGNEHFFEALELRQTNQQYHAFSEDESTTITTMLTDALARADSIGHLDLATALDNTLEDPKALSTFKPK